MGDELFNYVKKLVEKWRSEVRDLVTIDKVLTNFSIMNCDKCNGEGHIMVGGKAVDCDKCGPPYNDGLRTFRFAGSVVAVEERPFLKELGTPPGILYTDRAKNDGKKLTGTVLTRSKSTWLH